MPVVVLTFFIFVVGVFVVVVQTVCALLLLSLCAILQYGLSRFVPVWDFTGAGSDECMPHQRRSLGPGRL